MTGWRSSAVLVSAALLIAATSAPAAGDTYERSRSSRLFSFQGDDVYESSGLADGGRIVYTINDSGDRAVVYGVDSRTGRTVTKTTYASGVSDVEAIAPGSDGTVWVGDIGDNRADRDHIDLYHVRPLDGDHPARAFDLRYPDGPHDAETLLVQPRTGRIFVVSKGNGGTVYAAPDPLHSGSNRLRALANVDGLLTDGTFLPDGYRVLLRTYATASLYTFPGFRLIRTWILPDQPQGEGISVASDHRVLVSSEGIHADVLRVTLPGLFDSRLGPGGDQGKPSTRRPSFVTSRHTPPRTPAEWLGVAAVAGVGALGVVLFLRAAPRRGRRKR